MKYREPLVARGDTGSRSESTDNRPASVAGSPIVRSLVRDLDDPRGEPRGGRSLSAQVAADDVLDDVSVSAVPYGVLRELVQAQVRRECRRRDYDWDAFLADGPEWGITEVVHRRAVQQGRNRGLDCRPTDIPTDDVLTAVRDVIAEWTGQPALRPTEADFHQEQARRGVKGRESQEKNAARRGAEVLALVADGVCNNAEIGRRLGVDRSTVSRIRRKADASTVSPTFPAPEIPPTERWPIVQFTRWTGVHLDSAGARWLADMGRCYEADGLESELLDAIRASAGAVRDPWAYLQRCVVNRGDAWTLTPQLLGDVLTSAGQKSLEYALMAIGGGYVKRPLPYLRRTLQCAVSRGKRSSGSPLRSVAMAVRMAKEWAPELVIVDADEAIAAEEAGNRTGYVEPVQRRFGRLPWEREPVRETAAGLETSDVPNRCIGLKGLRGDDSNYQNLEYRNLESSPGSVKADATWAPREELGLVRTVGSPDSPDALLGPSPWERKKIEQPLKTGVLPDSDEILRPESDGEAWKLAQAAIDPLVREKVPVVFEHGRCRHPLASLLASAMVLLDVVLVDCAAGCGHRIYSDRGLLECPCHWPPAKAAWVARALQVP